MDFVPGLREEGYVRRGRPNKKWKSESVSARREVLDEYYRVREKNGSLSDYRICELIAGQWKKKGTSSLSGRSARTIYRELRLAQTEAFQRSGSFDIIFRQLVPQRPGLAATILTAKPEWSPRGFGRLGNDPPTPPELEDVLHRLAPIGNRRQKM